MSVTCRAVPVTLRDYMWRRHDKVVRVSARPLADDHSVAYHRGEPVADGTFCESGELVQPLIPRIRTRTIVVIKIVYPECQKDEPVGVSLGSADHVAKLFIGWPADWALRRRHNSIQPSVAESLRQPDHRILKLSTCIVEEQS